MRYVKLIFTGIAYSFLALASAQQPEDNYLKNYKAPDFRLRQLTVAGNGSGDGEVSATNKEHDFSINSSLTYQHLVNNQMYQGTIRSVYSNQSSFLALNGARSITFNQSLSNTMTNRFYFKDAWFIGFHDQSSASHAYSNATTDTLPSASFVNLQIRPAVSIGYGRVEWVQFGRQAMDIEQSLSKYGRLAPSFDQAGRTALADKIAQIRNRRYYDLRLGRIDQLQALDSVLQSAGLITDADIIYFSQLQDAFLYSYYTTRLSGFRHELGVTEGLSISSQTGNAATLTTNSYGFYSFSWFVPQSYAIQHDLRASVIGGLSADDNSATVNTFPLWLDVSYTFGFYPTTRTYLGATANSGLNLVSGSLGYMYGASLNAYYYISPKFRFNASADFIDGEGYNMHGFSHVAVQNNSRGAKVLNYDFMLGITYDIF
ncbi:MAG: hypothetical protein HYZ14_02150 [Bacteroidetes bacterium]|nr:hypothetical protein [Bacteroidota bacterium]